MTTEQLKVLLRNFRTMQAQTQFLEIKGKDNREISDEAKKIKRELDILQAALECLDEKERFIIEKHLIGHYTWPEIVTRMIAVFGMDGSRSERTLKRIQNQSLTKMLSFIENLSHYTIGVNEGLI